VAASVPGGAAEDEEAVEEEVAAAVDGEAEVQGAADL
jgi:hypothetical protein